MPDFLETRKQNKDLCVTVLSLPQNILFCLYFPSHSALCCCSFSTYKYITRVVTNEQKPERILHGAPFNDWVRFLFFIFLLYTHTRGLCHYDVYNDVCTTRGICHEYHVLYFYFSKVVFVFETTRNNDDSPTRKSVIIILLFRRGYARSCKVSWSVTTRT